MIPEAQRDVAALLGRLTGAAPIETHVSAVFVGVAEVLKLKKAVDLGFLDFSTLAARERFSRRELAVNQGFAPGLYRDVLPVTRNPDGELALGGAGAPVEWVLRMARVPAADFFDVIAAEGRLTPTLLDALADRVWAMHAKLPPAGSPRELSALLLAQRAAALHAGLPAARIEAWTAAAHAKLAPRSALLAARAAEGRVRRCHGDLHLGNLCLWQGQPTPFDALEFDEALATIDTGYDLAFLLMDLWQRAGPAAANRVLNRYVARGGDAGLCGALPLWLSLRALIRAHAEAAAGRDGLGYLALAEAMLRPAPARIVAIGGLPGSGKSTLARRLAPLLGPAPGALVLRSDEIRKRRHGVAPEMRLPAAAYAAAESAAVFTELFARAAAVAAAGHTVIADAMFGDPIDRAGIASAAAAAGVPFTALWLTASPDVLRERVAARQNDASDADLAVLEAALARNRGPVEWQSLDSTGDPSATAAALLGLSAR